MRQIIMAPRSGAGRGAQPCSAGVSHHQPITDTALGQANSVLEGHHWKLSYLFLKLHPGAAGQWDATIKGKYQEISWLLRFLLGLRISLCSPTPVGPQPSLQSTITSPGELGLRVEPAFKAGSGCWAHAITRHTIYLKHIPSWTSLFSGGLGHGQHGSSEGAASGIWPKQSQSCWWQFKNFN